jgi:hypothetical protein
MIYNYVYPPHERCLPVAKPRPCINTSLNIATRYSTALHLAIYCYRREEKSADMAIEGYSLFRRGNCYGNHLPLADEG